MSMYGLVSPGGAPGVTTAALALALSWPSQVLVAETDPGGPAVLAGLFAGHLDGSRNLLHVAYDAISVESAVAEVPRQLVNLDPTGTRMLLPGVPDPRQAAALDPAWPVLAAALASSPGTVLADCGRLDGGPGQDAILAAAHHILLVLRPTLRQVAAARPRLQMLTDPPGRFPQVTLLLTGPGPLSGGEISRVLGLPVTGVLPDDSKTAAVLSDGQGRRTALQNTPLLRAAAGAGKALRALTAAQSTGSSATDALSVQS